ncbi:MAG: T9SS type A sorting domain-containing protein [Rufibacter sp.]
MNGKYWILLAALCLLLQASAGAQERQLPKEEQEALKKQLATYHQQEVATFLLNKRKELDQKLSAADKQELTQVREELMKHRAHQLAYFQKIREERKASKQPITDAQKSEIKAQHARYKQIMDRVELLAQKNSKALAPIAIQVKVQQEKWHRDIQAITAKYRGPATEPEASIQAKRELLLERRRNHWSPTRFLLLDPNQASSVLDFLEKEGNKNNSLQEENALLISPNPVTDVATLSYSVPKEGTVRIELVNQQGKVLKQVLDSDQPVGRHQQPVEVTDLNSGVYYYRITSPAGSEAVRFMKQ